jgi:N-acetylmuramoyl-L-alanine amidase
MGAFRHLGGWVLFGCAGWMCAAQMPARQSGPRAWDDAVAARQQFEAEPAGTHTKAEYARVMDGFRAIYHGNPVDVHAARAVEQVAELLAEQGHELGDAKSLKSAAGQYDFLREQYPGSSAGRAAGPKADELRAELERPVEAAPVVRVAPAENADSSAALRNGKQEALRNGKEELRGGKQEALRGDTRKVDTAPQGDEHYHPPVHETAVSEVAAPVESGNVAKKMAMVTGIRHWSTPTYTRVAIDLGDEVTYQAARVEHPDRIYFDLHHTRLAHELSGKSYAVTDDGFLTRIRAAQFSDDVTRVVLDVHQVTEYTAFLLPNPYRLIIDIHGQGSGEDNKPATNEAAAVDAAPAQSAGPAAGVSSLPAMAVTDGSSGFGLPKKNDGAAKSDAAVAQPRVVIPSRPTAQKPVPNTVMSRSAETGTEVAAVSLQPGRVIATSRPTSGPIVERSRGTRSEIRETKLKTVHVQGEPAEAAPPTADGQTSMMRALGLKIGRIVIDAGHGGHDSGTLGVDGIEEKDVALDVALRLGKLLHDRLGAEIVYTRADDTFIPLETRTAIANKAQADLFISVHCNSSPDASARGVEVYYLNFTSDADAMRVAARENAVSDQSVHDLSDLVKKIALKDKIDESKELAGDVDESLYAGLARGNGGLKNRGVKKAPFVVLIGANMPSILAEISFVTNPTDAAELQTPEYRERVAESLFKGVARYAGGINGWKAPKVATTQRAALWSAAE